MQQTLGRILPIDLLTFLSVFVQPQTQTWIKEADEKKKCKIYVAKKQKRLRPA